MLDWFYHRNEIIILIKAEKKSYVQKTHFTWNNKIYIKKARVTMGPPVGHILADIAMDELESII